MAFQDMLHLVSQHPGQLLGRPALTHQRRMHHHEAARSRKGVDRVVSLQNIAKTVAMGWNGFQQAVADPCQDLGADRVTQAVLRRNQHAHGRPAQPFFPRDRNPAGHGLGHRRNPPQVEGGAQEREAKGGQQGEPATEGTSGRIVEGGRLGRNGVDGRQETGVVDQQGLRKRGSFFQANLFAGIGALGLAHLTIVPPEGAAVRFGDLKAPGAYGDPNRLGQGGAAVEVAPRPLHLGRCSSHWYSTCHRMPKSMSSSSVSSRSAMPSPVAPASRASCSMTARSREP